MVVQRVFVIWTNPLFHDSVRMILNHPDVEWVGSTSDYTTARDKILSLQPSVVIVEEVEGANPALVFSILEWCNWNMRVINLSLTDNKYYVYHRQQKIVGQAEDLLRLIQGNL